MKLSVSQFHCLWFLETALQWANPSSPAGPEPKVQWRPGFPTLKFHACPARVSIGACEKVLLLMWLRGYVMLKWLWKSATTTTYCVSCWWSFAYATSGNKIMSYSLCILKLHIFQLIFCLICKDFESSSYKHLIRNHVFFCYESKTGCIHLRNFYHYKQVYINICSWDDVTDSWLVIV